MSVPNAFTSVSSATGAQLDSNFAACSQLNANNNYTGAQNFSPTATIASASTTAIGAASANSISITGTASITNFDSVSAGIEREVIYAGLVPIVYNATNMILIGGVSRTNNVGDVSIFISLGSGNWKEIMYQPLAGYALATGSITLTAFVAGNLYNSQFLGGL